jgi:hypothetical protein
MIDETTIGKWTYLVTCMCALVVDVCLPYLGTCFLFVMQVTYLTISSSNDRLLHPACPLSMQKSMSIVHNSVYRFAAEL